MTLQRNVRSNEDPKRWFPWYLSLFPRKLNVLLVRREFKEFFDRFKLLIPKNSQLKLNIVDNCKFIFNSLPSIYLSIPENHKFGKPKMFLKEAEIWYSINFLNSFLSITSLNLYRKENSNHMFLLFNFTTEIGFLERNFSNWNKLLFEFRQVE